MVVTGTCIPNTVGADGESWSQWPAGCQPSSRFSERSCFKGMTWSLEEQDTPSSGFHLHVQAYTQMHKNKRLLKKLNRGNHACYQYTSLRTIKGLWMARRNHPCLLSYMCHLVILSSKVAEKHPAVCKWLDTIVGISLLFAATKVWLKAVFCFLHSPVLGRCSVRLSNVKKHRAL